MWWHEIFHGLLQKRGWEKLAENLHVSPFKEDLSNDATFGKIHLAGQYL
jgi:hypothetical protein